jgi:hypothetical protein
LVPAWEKDVTLSGRKIVLGDRFQRLVDWNVEQLVNFLKKIVAKRNEIETHGKYPALSCPDDPPRDEPQEQASPEDNSTDTFDLRTNHNVLDQQIDVITFPKRTPAEAIAVDSAHNNKNSVNLDSEVVVQLHEFMTSIATFYQEVSVLAYAEYVVAFSPKQTC